MGNPPNPPSGADIAANANQVASNQAGFNLNAWLSSLINQQGPWGSVQYQQSGTTPSGNPIMTAITKYAPGVQALFDQLLGNKGVAGKQAGDLLINRNYGAENPENVVGNLSQGITGGIMDQWKSFHTPFFQQAKDRLHTQLSNRGLVPGQPAYDAAMRELDTNQGLTINNLIGTVGSKAYELASGLYKMPAELAMLLGQFGSPASATQDFTSHLPQMQPPNLIGAQANMAQQMNDIWKAQTQKYGDLWGGIGKIGSSVLGGWASSPSGGSAITSAMNLIPSMFALSDARYKTDIVPMGTRINGIPVYSFRFPWETRRRLGMLAQEVEKVMPDAVAVVDDVKFVDYAKTLAQ